MNKLLNIGIKTQNSSVIRELLIFDMKDMSPPRILRNLSISDYKKNKQNQVHDINQIIQMCKKEKFNVLSTILKDHLEELKHILFSSLNLLSNSELRKFDIVLYHIVLNNDFIGCNSGDIFLTRLSKEMNPFFLHIIHNWQDY